MIPTWTAVLAAISLALIALAALADVREMVSTIRSEAEGIVGTSRDVRTRITRAADAAEQRLQELDALMEVVQEEVQDAAIGVASTLRDARSGVRLLQWTRQLLSASKNKKKRGRR